MIRVQKMIATVGGIGYIGRGAGTVAAVVYVAVWLLTPLGTAHLLQAILFFPLLVAGILSAGAVENEWGYDSNKVVIDEVAGMMLSLLFLPVAWPWAVAGLLLFRFFDIVKPLGIRRTERLPGGWGIMADDLLAGLYAQLLLRFLLAVKLL